MRSTWAGGYIWVDTYVVDIYGVDIYGQGGWMCIGGNIWGGRIWSRWVVRLTYTGDVWSARIVFLWRREHIATWCVPRRA